jgi:hypothetical protein
MNIDQLKKWFRDDDALRRFFESILWKEGRICSHCYCDKSYHPTATIARLLTNNSKFFNFNGTEELFAAVSYFTPPEFV